MSVRVHWYVFLLDRIEKVLIDSLYRIMAPISDRLAQRGESNMQQESFRVSISTSLFFLVLSLSYMALIAYIRSKRKTWE